MNDEPRGRGRDPRDDDRGRGRDGPPRDGPPRDGPPREPPPAREPRERPQPAAQALITMEQPPVFRPLDVQATPLRRPNRSAEINNVIVGFIEVMKSVRDVPKLGYNKSEKYEFVQWADLSALLQDALVKAGLAISQREVHRETIRSSKGDGAVVIIRFQFDVYHVSGQYIEDCTEGSGACRFEFKTGTIDDKSVNKAITAGQKAMLTSLFKIPADSDIERSVFVDPDGQLTDEGRGRTDDRRDERRDDRNDDRRDERRDDRREPPPDARREPPRDDRQEAPRGEERRPNPPYDPGGPPPNWDTDAPPFDGPPAGYGGGAPARSAPPREEESQVERDFKKNVGSFQETLFAVPPGGVAEADRIWTENRDLIRQMSDQTYEYFRENFAKRFDRAPPN